MNHILKRDLYPIPHSLCHVCTASVVAAHKNNQMANNKNTCLGNLKETQKYLLRNDLEISPLQKSIIS